MSVVFVYGADCQLGYGIEREAGYVLPFKGELLELRTAKKNHWGIIDNARYIQPLNENCLNTLENELNIQGDEADYHNVYIYKCNGYEQCKGVDKYPEKTSSLIRHRTYGLLVNIIVKKHALPFDQNQTAKFVIDVIQNGSRLSPDLEDLKCFVVINGRESHKWTLKKLVDFCKEHGEDEKYQCTLSVNVRNRNSDALRIQNKEKLMDFLKYLYLCYRKLEITLAKQKSFQRYEFKYNSSSYCNSILSEIDAISVVCDAISEYRKTVKDSNVATYIAMKKLFHSYKYYLEFCILRQKNFKVTDEVVEGINELQAFWKKLIASTVVLESNEQQEYAEDSILETLKCERLKNFLKILHQCIKKIEVKLDKVGYPLFENDVVTTTASVKSVGSELQKSTEEYQIMSKTGFLNMYPTMKQLFCSYLRYIKLHTTYNIPLDEEIPGTIDELNLWSDKLDSWSLRKVGNEWCGSDETLFFFNDNDAHLDPLLKKMKEKEKFKVVSATNLGDDERFMIKHSETMSNVGLFQPKTGLSNENCDGNNVYESKCPSKECPDVQRKWMCTDCCELLKIKNVSCGCQDYELNQLEFICPSKKHPRITGEEHDESSVSDVSSKDEKIKELTMKLKESERKLGQV